MDRVRSSRLARLFSLQRKARRGDAASAGVSLHFASVTDEALGADEPLGHALYLVLAASAADAARLVQQARSSPCEVRMRAHRLPVDAAVAAYKLAPNVARLVWPREETAPPLADDYLFAHEPRTPEERALAGIMRGGQAAEDDGAELERRLRWA